MKISPRLKIAMLSFLSALMAFTLVCYLFISWIFHSLPFHPNPFDTLTFNQRNWLEDQSCVDGSNRRGHMADDILLHHLHLGMAEAQIMALLGTPDHVYTRAQVQHHLNAYKRGLATETYFRQTDLQAARVDDYYLGEELSMGWGVNCAWLYLYMDAQGKYIGYRIEAP